MRPHQSDLEAVATAECAESLLHSQRQSLDEGVQVDHAVVHRLDHSQQLAQRLLEVSLSAHHVRALLQVLKVMKNLIQSIYDSSGLDILNKLIGFLSSTLSDLNKGEGGGSPPPANSQIT